MNEPGQSAFDVRAVVDMMRVVDGPAPAATTQGIITAAVLAADEGDAAMVALLSACAITNELAVQGARRRRRWWRRG